MLYIVGTPIGNLEDLSIRQAKTLSRVEVILTEDTRSTIYLLVKIKELFHLAPRENQRLISYYREKEFEKLPEIINLLKEEKDIALISESGMPAFSDPGYLLLKTVISEQIPFTVIPGPTAAVTALIYSGFNPQNAFFIGFLPKKYSELKKLLNNLKEFKKIFPKAVIVAYESPRRIAATLATIDDLSPELEVVIGRELTKKFEEVVRGSAKELMNRTFKGEITMVLS